MQATIIFEQNWNAIHEMAYHPDGSPVLNMNGQHERKYKYIINEGSSRSSKTFSLIDCCDLYARSNESKRITVWRSTKIDAVKTAFFDIKRHLRKTNRWFVGHTFNQTQHILAYTTDSTVEIHGADDEETVMGLNQEVAWLNEPYQISREVFDQIDQRTSDFIFIDWNPKKSHWIDEIKKDKRALVIHSTFRDNPFCPAEQRTKILSYQPVKFAQVVLDGKIPEKDAHVYDLAANKIFFTERELVELARCIENERKGSASEFNWCVYGLGTKAERPNRIFKFDEISYQEYLQIDKEKIYASDWGAVDPWGILEAKYYDGCLYLHEHNYRSENIIRQNLAPTEQIQVNGVEEGIVSWMFKKLAIPYESVVVCDNNRPLKILALRNAGWEYAIAAIKSSGAVVDGIDLVNNLKVYYTSESVNIKYEQENYSRRVDRFGAVLEEPEDFDNHLMDCVRYVALFLQSQGIIRNI